MKFDELDLRSYGLKRERGEDYNALYMYKAYRVGRTIVYGAPDVDHINVYAKFNTNESVLKSDDLPNADHLGKFSNPIRLDPTKEAVGKFVEACKEYNDLCDNLEQDHCPTKEQLTERLNFVKDKAIKELALVTDFIKSDKFIERFVTIQNRTLAFFQTLYKDLIKASKLDVEEEVRRGVNNKYGAILMRDTEYLLTNNSREYDAIIRDVIGKK